MKINLPNKLTIIRIFMVPVFILFFYISMYNNNYIYVKTNIYRVISAIIFIISMLPKNTSDTTFFENTVYRYASIIFVFFISFAILICGYIKKKNEKGEEKTLEKTN